MPVLEINVLSNLISTPPPYRPRTTMSISPHPEGIRTGDLVEIKRPGDIWLMVCVGYGSFVGLWDYWQMMGGNYDARREAVKAMLAEVGDA